MNKTETLRRKWIGIIPIRTFDVLERGDKTPTKKYLDYMCYLRTKDIPTNDVIKTIDMFDDLLPYISNKDIYSKDYKDINFLTKVLNKAFMDREEKTFNKEEHIEIIDETDEYLLIRPKTKVGAIKYGYDTKWCTSATKSNLFPSHYDNGYLYYLIHKTNTKNIKYSKLAFYVSRSNIFNGFTIFNSQNDEISKSNLEKSIWPISTIQNIYLLLSKYNMELENKRLNFDYIQDVINKLNKIDFVKVNQVISSIENENEIMSNFSEVINRFKDFLENKTI
jgi:hypothetical protein